MFEYVYFLEVILGDNHYVPIELTIDRSIKFININNIHHHALFTINQAKGNNVKDITKDLKKYTIEKIKSIFFLKDHEYCELFYCFGVAPRNVRWDLMGLKSIISDKGISEPVIKIASNFIETNEYLRIKRIKTKTKTLKKETKSKVIKYIDKILTTYEND